MQEKRPEVSVIISTYNRSKNLKRCIESVLAQSFTNFEIIVVDDCSTDDTQEVVKKFKDKRVKYIQTLKNSGHDGLPKNMGVDRAKGEFITFLDDDDLYRPDALKVLYTYIGHTQANVVYGDYLTEDKKGKRKLGWTIDFQPSLLGRMNYIAMSVVIVNRKSFIAVGGFNENIPKFKDWNLWLRMQKAGNIFVHIPIITTIVTMGEETISTKYKVDYDEQGNYLPTYFNPADCKMYADKSYFGKPKKLKVAIYTLTLDRLEYTQRMWESLEKTACYDFDWIVIDQGSKDGTPDFLKGRAKHVIQNKKNTGVDGGWNQALKYLKGEDYDVWVKLDNDAELMTDGWLRDAVDLLERNSKLILSPYVEGLENSPGGVMRSRMDGESPYLSLNDKILGLVPNLGGICFITHRDLFSHFHFPEGDNRIAGNKDYFLSQYAQQIGYSMFYMEEYRLWHMDGTDGQHKKFPEYFKKLYGKDTKK